jgi:adenine-specific DNA-methyltransferase
MEEGEKKGPVLFFVVEEPKTLLLPLHVVEAAKNIPSPFFLRLSPHPDPPQLVGRAWRRGRSQKYSLPLPWGREGWGSMGHHDMKTTPTEQARHLRKNPTEAERRLWGRLRYRQLEGARFRRQAPIGPYIADFVCFDKKLVVEVDGGQHAERLIADEKRTAWLRAQGFHVVRFWNHDVLTQTDAVLIAIKEALDHPHPGPPPQVGRDRRSQMS